MVTPLAVVTGATGGIGAAISEKLCQEGISVVLVGRDSQHLQTRRESLAAQYPNSQVYAQRCDITSSADREALVNAVRQLSHPATLWINNAGVNHFGLLHQQTEADVAALLDINIKASILLTQTILKSADPAVPMQIINMGSTFGAIGYPGFAAYSASKFALRGFTQALDRELADTAIRVRYFAPRATRTSLNAEAVNAMNNELKVTMDTPAVVAEHFIRFMHARRKTVHLGFPERLFARLNSLFPGLVSNALKKQLPIIKRYASMT